MMQSGTCRALVTDDVNASRVRVNVQMLAPYLQLLKPKILAFYDLWLKLSIELQS